MQGVIAAVPTPIDAQGKFLAGPFVAHCEWLLENGCDGLNVLGSTGEANSLDKQTRISVMRTAAQHLDISRLMVGTATPSLAETVALTEIADDLGYQVALVLPPYYYKPLSDEYLINWYTRLHLALGDRAISLYFYNYPQMTGIVIPAAVIEQLHKRWPNRFAGIKDSSGDLPYCRELAVALPKLKIFPSSEIALSEAHESGFAGCISATTNQTSALSAKLWSGRRAPDPKITAEVAQIRGTIAGPTLVAAVKYLVAYRTKQPEWENVVPPFKGLETEQKAALDPVIALLAVNLQDNL